MKKYILIASTLFLSSLAFAQQLQVHSTGKEQYIEHKVVAKENFFSVGRLYAVAPKEIASYNKLDMAHGLTIGQVIKIPLTVANFSQTTETKKPVYYVVGEKEGLYRVSLKNNNVLMASLRKWNHLQNDNIKTGSKLIVGFIGGEATNAVAANTLPAGKAEQPKEMVKEQAKEVKQAETKKVEAEPIVKKEAVEEKKETAPERKEAEKKAEEPKPQPIDTKPVQTQAIYTASYNGGDGYFKKEFEKQTKGHGIQKEQTTNTGIFKTASGWQDGKYYAMIDGVEPGTIIKVVNPSNNKTIYAKVLSEMSGIRQNQGLDLRISNAAANALEVQDTEKFVVKVGY